MLANVAQIVRQFKRSWTRELEDEAIERACQAEIEESVAFAVANPEPSADECLHHVFVD